MPPQTLNFDQSGFAGYNLLDPAQPIFAIANADMDKNLVDEILRAPTLALASTMRGFVGNMLTASISDSHSLLRLNCWMRCSVTTRASVATRPAKTSLFLNLSECYGEKLGRTGAILS